ncbi:MAG: hypothetical protein V2B20_08670 [Pseudomonadota bacterium]
MKSARFILLGGLIFLYGSLFAFQEKKGLEREIFLQAAMPATFYQITTGYLKQLAAEMLFIRTCVFLGGVPPGTPETSYAGALGNNLRVMTRLYPRFLDPYFICQAFLPHVSLEAAVETNTILETGILAYPEHLLLRFFHGANFFMSMNEPIKGAKAFEEAAKLPNAPPMFAHLAALLLAQGGDLVAGLISLKTMVASEKDEGVHARYQQEIMIFEQAIDIQVAIKTYIKKYGAAPETLVQLVPEFIGQIPDIKDSFILVYNPPTLHLRRPDRK